MRISDKVFKEYNKKEKTFSVDVPENAYEISIDTYPGDEYFHVNYKLTVPKDADYTSSGGFALMFNNFGGKRYYPKNIEIAERNGETLKCKYE